MNSDPVHAETVVLVLGIIPIAAIMVHKVIFGLLPFFGIGSIFRDIRSYTHWYEPPLEAPLAAIGGSNIQPASMLGSQPNDGADLGFLTLKCQAQQVSESKWLLSVVFELLNRTDSEIVFDDVHVRIFERDSFAPALDTISYFGDVWIARDNTLIKEDRSYSVSPADGFQLRLNVTATRVEGAPAYGASPTEKGGQLLVVFGIVIDYYIRRSGGHVERACRSSDSVYVLNSSGVLSGRAFFPVNQQSLISLRSSNGVTQSKATTKFFDRLGQYLEDHFAFRPRPKA